jgi:chlorophyllide a oxygenase
MAADDVCRDVRRACSHSCVCCALPWCCLDVALQVPNTTQPPAGYDIHAEIQLEVPVEHGLLIENLLDLAHAPFTHQG